MGTNIYLRKIVSKEEIEETKRKLNEMADDVKSIDDLKDVISFLQDECERYEKDIVRFHADGNCSSKQTSISMPANGSI